jgi:hypothetical protein
MADKNKAKQVEEKIRQALEQLGQAVEKALDSWLNKQRPTLHPIPIPIDRPRPKTR